MKDRRPKPNQLIVISKEASVWSLPLGIADAPRPSAVCGALNPAVFPAARRTCRRCIPYGSTRSVRRWRCVRAAPAIGHRHWEQAFRRPIDQTQSARALRIVFSGCEWGVEVRPGKMSLKAWPYALRRFVAIRTNLTARKTKRKQGFVDWFSWNVSNANDVGRADDGIRLRE